MLLVSPYLPRYSHGVQRARDEFDYTQIENISLYLLTFNGVSIVIIALWLTTGLARIGFPHRSDVAKREQEYAILCAVSGSRGWVFSGVFGEFVAIVLSAAGISLFLGISFGYTRIILTVCLDPFSSPFQAELTIPYYIVGVTVGTEQLVLILSCYYPAKRAGKVDPAIVLRNP